MVASDAALAAAQRHHRSGDLPTAEAMYRAILERDPGHLEARFGLGLALGARGAHVEAEASFRLAASLKPDLAEAWNNLGNALREQGRLAEAMPPLLRALELRPGFPEAGLNLAAVLEDAGRVEEAVACLERLLAAEPRNAHARNNLGSALKKLGRLEEARAHLEAALRERPDFAEAWNNLGAVFEQAGQTPEAIGCYREALRLRPNFAEAHLNLGMVCLLAGRFEEGWAEYEWRWRVRGARPRQLGRPMWDGASPAGRRILLWAEQGLGDTVQFARYAPLVKGLGATVYLECPWRLVPLMKRLPGVDRLIPAGSPLPEFDVHAPLMSLPGLLETASQLCWPIPYLEVPEGRVRRLRQVIGRPGQRTVGLCWATNARARNARDRSIPAPALAALAPLPGIAWFSLQRGMRADAAGLPVTELEEPAGDVLDTAAAIACLDLVISADTLVAHLAGALARPVWTLLPFAPDFRWLLSRDDSPWYPTMRLFRQPRPGAWDAVIERVRDALDD